MTTPLQMGRIVWAELVDANGIRKVRPAVIVTPTEWIPTAARFEVVAITSRLDRPLPTDHVLLPWHPQGHPRTGLNRKCAAVCGWLGRIGLSDIRDLAGVVPGPILLDILSRLTARQAAPDTPLSDASQTPPADPEC